MIKLQIFCGAVDVTRASQVCLATLRSAHAPRSGQLAQATTQITGPLLVHVESMAKVMQSGPDDDDLLITHGHSLLTDLTAPTDDLRDSGTQLQD
jgi:hypothetical protein